MKRNKVDCEVEKIKVKYIFFRKAVIRKYGGRKEPLICQVEIHI